MSVDLSAVAEKLREIRDDLYREAKKYDWEASEDDYKAHSAFIDAGNGVDSAISDYHLPRM